MSTATELRTTIKLKGHRKRRFAEALRSAHATSIITNSSSIHNPIRVVCISDTHNNVPTLPAGDILIHAGDLTENGSFEEVQAGLTWLSSQPFQHKIFVAGNHDVLLDEDFLVKYPERRYGHEKTAAALDWGSVKYLRDSCMTLDVTLQGGDLHHDSHKESTSRRVTVFGSP